jgi:hypothetical protein
MTAGQDLPEGGLPAFGDGEAPLAGEAEGVRPRIRRADTGAPLADGHIYLLFQHPGVSEPHITVFRTDAEGRLLRGGRPAILATATGYFAFASAGPLDPAGIAAEEWGEVQGGDEMTVPLCPPLLHSPRWGRLRARYGQVARLRVDTRGVAEGAWVEFEVLEHDADGQHDSVARFSAAVRGGVAEAGWCVGHVADDDDEPTEIDRQTGFALPEFIFVARLGAAEARCEERLMFATDLEMPLVDEGGQPLADTEYELRCGTQVKRGRTDADGVLREEGVGPDFAITLVASGRRIIVESTRA